MPRTARQAIKTWYSTHPKTMCPVIGQSICPLKGCENPVIRADPRCNIDLKQAQAEARPGETEGLDELRGWIYDLRDSPDSRRWILNFGYNRALLDDFRQLIPASGRRFDPETRAWRKSGIGMTRPKIRRITMPALLLRGAQSGLISPAMVRRMNRKIKGSVVKEIPRAYHHVPLDNPGDTAAAIIDFIEKI